MQEMQQEGRLRSDGEAAPEGDAAESVASETTDMVVETPAEIEGKASMGPSTNSIPTNTGIRNHTSLSHPPGPHPGGLPLPLDEHDAVAVDGDASQPSRAPAESPPRNVAMDVEDDKQQPSSPTAADSPPSQDGQEQEAVEERSPLPRMSPPRNDADVEQSSAGDVSKSDESVDISSNSGTDSEMGSVTSEDGRVLPVSSGENAKGLYGLPPKPGMGRERSDSSSTTPSIRSAVGSGGVRQRVSSDPSTDSAPDASSRGATGGGAGQPNGGKHKRSSTSPSLREIAAAAKGGGGGPSAVATPASSSGSSQQAVTVASGIINSVIPGHVRGFPDQHDIVEQSPQGRYVRFHEKLGSGAYKDVYRAYDTIEGIEVAWNQVNLAGIPRSDKMRIINEVKLLERLHHQNIISFHGSWVNRELEQVLFVTEIMSSGTLKSFINKVKVIRWKIAKRWAMQILKGLEYLHSQDPPIIHRDLKCDNIFINGTTGDLRIGDLGLSTVISSRSKVLSVLGTPEFMAPELYDESYDEKVDIYAFGMCLLEMFTKEVPYRECSNPAQIYKKVTNGIPPASLSRVRSPLAREFIQYCLGTSDENGLYERPSATELLQHPFLAKGGVDDDSEVEVDPPVQESVIEEDSCLDDFDTVSRGSSSMGQPDKDLGAGSAHGQDAVPLSNVNGLNFVKGVSNSSQNGSARVPPVQPPPISSRSTSVSSMHRQPMPSYDLDSHDDDGSDHFSGMPESEVNMKKVKVFVGRGQEIEDEDADAALGADQDSPAPLVVDNAGALPSDGGQSITPGKRLSGQEGNVTNDNVEQAVSPRYPVSEQPTGEVERDSEVMKLIITLPVEGRPQNVQFDFHLVEDDPIQVAREMVTELHIHENAVLDISETISSLACAARIKKESHRLRHHQQQQGTSQQQESGGRWPQQGQQVTSAPEKPALPQQRPETMNVPSVVDAQRQGGVMDRQHQDMHGATWPQQGPQHAMSMNGTHRVRQHVAESGGVPSVVHARQPSGLVEHQQQNIIGTAWPQQAQQHVRAHQPTADSTHMPPAGTTHQQIIGSNQHQQNTGAGVQPQPVQQQSVTGSHRAPLPNQRPRPTADQLQKNSAMSVRPQQGQQQVIAGNQRSLKPNQQTRVVDQQQQQVQHQQMSVNVNTSQLKNEVREVVSGAPGAPTQLAGGTKHQVVDAVPTAGPSMQTHVTSEQLPVPRPAVEGKGERKSSPFASTQERKHEPVSFHSRPQGQEPNALGRRSTDELESSDGESDYSQEQLRRMEEEYQKNLHRAKKAYETRMDNLHRSLHEREAQHQKTIEKHEKDLADFEKRVKIAEAEQHRRLTELQENWSRQRAGLAKTSRGNDGARNQQLQEENKQSAEKVSHSKSSSYLNRPVSGVPVNGSGMNGKLADEQSRSTSHLSSMGQGGVI